MLINNNNNDNNNNKITGTLLMYESLAFVALSLFNKT
jgi:hypothetical protein